MGEVIPIGVRHKKDEEPVMELRCVCGHTHFEINWYHEDRDPVLICSSCENHIPYARFLDPS